MNPLTELIRPYVDELKAQAAAGNVKAKQVISLYEMHCDCPSDRGAPALCEAAFKDWKRSQ